MAVPEPEIHRGSGPDMLPYGASVTLNRRLASLPQQQAPGPSPQTQPPSPEAAQPMTAPAPFVPTSARDKAIYGTASDRPQEPVYAGVTGGNNPAPPSDVMDVLPIIAQAAQMPGASAPVQTLFHQLTYQQARARYGT